MKSGDSTPRVLRLVAFSQEVEIAFYTLRCATKKVPENQSNSQRGEELENVDACDVLARLCLLYTSDAADE